MLTTSAEGATTPETVSLLDDGTKLLTSRLGLNRFRVAGTAEFNGEMLADAVEEKNILRESAPNHLLSPNHTICT